MTEETVDLKLSWALTLAEKEVERLKVELADVKDDYLRRHKDAVDRWEEIQRLKAENAKLRAALKEIIDLPPTCYCGVIARRALT